LPQEADLDYEDDLTHEPKEKRWIFNVKVILGKRDDIRLDLLGRILAQKLFNLSETAEDKKAKPLLLSVALHRDTTMEDMKQIAKLVEAVY
jgi:hypothetical protein